MTNANVVSNQPVVALAFFDGSSAALVYTPSLLAARGYRLTLSASSVPAVTNSDSASGWTQIDGVSFVPGVTMELTLDTLGINGAPVGTSLKVAFPQPTPSLVPADAVYFPDGNLQVRWTPPPAGNINPLQGYRLLLSDRSSGRTRLTRLPMLATSNAVVALGSDTPLSPTLEFRLAAVNANLAGPASPPWGFVSSAPRNLRLAVGTDRIEIWWQASTDPAVTSELPRLYAIEDGWAEGVDGSSDGPGHGYVQFDPGVSGKTWYVAVIARSAVPAVAAASWPMPVPLQLATLTSVQASADGLLLIPATTTGLAARAIGMSGEVARDSTNAAPLLLRADPNLITSLAWRIADGAALGPEQVIDLNLTAPPTASIHTDPITAASTLRWSALPSAVAYVIRLAAGAAPVRVAGANSVDLPAQWQSNPALAAQIASVSVSAGIEITSLDSLACGPLPPPPEGLQVAYDGLLVRANWSARPELDGYRVSIYAAGTTEVTASVDLPGAADSAVLPAPTGGPGQNWMLTIQSLRAGAVGLPATALPLVAAGWYPAPPRNASRVNSAALAPLANAAALAAFSNGQGVDLSWLLPPLASQALTGTLPSTPSFKLIANSDPAWPYRLLIGADSPLWQFDGTPLRSSLLADLKTLLLGLETAGAAAFGLDLVQRVIARGAPLTFQETLYVEYGLTGPNPQQAYGSFDLRPGMLLRVLSPGYLDLDPDASGALLNGFAASGSLDYEIGVDRSNGWRPRLDAFFAQLVALGAIAVKPPPSSSGGTAQGGMADAADLYYPQLSLPYLRVLLPTTLLSATSGGSTKVSDQIIVVGAPSYSQLVAITSPPAKSTIYGYFRGRSVLQPRLRYRFNGSACSAPIGSTIADALQANGALPAGTAAAMTGLRLRRQLGPLQSDPNAAVQPGQSAPLHLGWGGLAAWSQGGSALDLPLLSGDSIDFT